MRINNVQKDMNFKQLKVNTHKTWGLKETVIQQYKEKLADTKNFDVIVDSTGISLKRKMTDINQKIQSFSLYMKENALGIHVIGDKRELFKFSYATLEEAKLAWQHLNNSDKQDRLKGYGEVALLLDKKFDEIA